MNILFGTVGVAVMVYIHGDSYSWGSAGLYDGRVLATLGRIIVVTFNFRIGILGWYLHSFGRIRIRLFFRLVSVFYWVWSGSLLFFTRIGPGFFCG